ncbi:MAG: flagellar biosynthesis regulator FlaF [Rhodospirillaceae bacterium]|nr:flagellar biosynthesis regulator FlaF [Rhodospirillaceae bacterium]MBL6931352.1 flagellar biosynthesis regulator FlaF [Rhodospirillales bacterium]
MSSDLTKSYARIQKSTPGGRHGEAAAFVETARKIHEAAQAPIDVSAYARSLQNNQKLWTLLQASLLEDEGRLPEDLRQDILKLSIFVDKQTLKALALPSFENVASLIDINRNMAGGLFQKPKE